MPRAGVNSRGRHRRHSPMRLNDTVVARFWSKVAIRGEDECWFWTAGCGHGGHGIFWVPGEGSHNASRVAYAIAHGPLQRGEFALHNCPGGDNADCVNPKHLWKGTQKDNMADAAAKGRLTGRYHGSREA